MLPQMRFRANSFVPPTWVYLDPPSAMPPDVNLRALLPLGSVPILFPWMIVPQVFVPSR